MSITFLERLEASDHLALRRAVEYAAECDCAEGGSTPTVGCDCICCQAEWLRRKLWPAAVPTMFDRLRIPTNVIEGILDFVDNADAFYRPESVQLLGVPQELVGRLARSFKNVRGIRGGDLIEAIADQVADEPNDASQDSAGQRAMEAAKTAIRSKLGLAADPEEIN
jgi:hypothetical protein